jgi:carbonic anhydrase/acetyltransferase-like protein (isoleucine patch superfamily)
MMQQKYKLNRDISLRIGEKTVYVIEALRDFGDVEEGDIGGFIESEENLSHDGDCWVYDSAIVYGKGRVNRDAKIKDQAHVYDYATVSDKAVISGQVEVFQRAVVYDEAVIEGLCTVYGNAQVFGKAQIRGHSKIHDDAWVYGDIEIDGYANITRKTTMTPIVLTGFTYDVTIMDEHISIDCQTKTFDEWRAVTREEAFAMNGKESLRFFKHIPDTLEFLVQKYRKKQSNV